MSYLVYLYDTKGDLLWVDEAETDEPLVCTCIEADDEKTIHRAFILMARGKTVRGEPRLIYYEGEAR
jgi:hypothetical protein